MRFNTNVLFQCAAGLLALAGIAEASALPVFEGNGEELMAAQAGSLEKRGKYEWAVVLGTYDSNRCDGWQRDATQPDGVCYKLGNQDYGMKIFWLAQGCRVLVTGENGACTTSGGTGTWYSNLNECIPLNGKWFYQVYC
ncbi:hypothetical protein MCOR25_010389 [Pyricularia grisea]|nr:hypothetical protein MCOR25_010389 [Pyricularia grisea]